MRELGRSFGVLIAVLLLAGTVAAVPAPQSEKVGYDSVTVDVIRLLGQGLTPELVSEWLERTGRQPEQLGAEDLIALKQAGATESLVQELVYLAKAGDKQAPAPPPAAPAVEEEPSGPAEVEFTLRYSPWKAPGPEGAWHLFVYLNGEFLLWSPGVEETVDLSRSIEPGHATVRFLLERHTLTSTKKKTWEHEARVCLAPLELEIRPGAQLRIEINAGNEIKGVAWKVLSNGELVDEASGKGGGFAGWPKLCEEILANIPKHKWQRSRTRELMVGCAEWDSLWPATADLQVRDEVRKALAKQEYRPVF